MLIAGGDSTHPASLTRRLNGAGSAYRTAETLSDDPCFWLYSSGSTGAPKGTVHVHSSLIQTAELYARPILGLTESDVCFSAAKLFFAYGLGNSLTFPLAVGATTILMAERPTPAAIFAQIAKHQPTIFCGVPTLYAGMLASPELPNVGAVRLRRCVSAGEPLPEEIGHRWQQHFGVEILDGIGSTEMLHIFLSNRPGEVQYGTTGRPVPGYAIRLVDDHGNPVPRGENGELQVAGPSSAAFYWNNRELSRRTFLGPWTRTSDKYHRAGATVISSIAGRSDDMLKVGGIYVSPSEVESALISHEAVLEAAVVGREDGDGLQKPLAYVVVKSGVTFNEELSSQLKQHVKSRLAPYKYPRWIEFCDELPKTATGKIQRFKLRALAGVPRAELRRNDGTIERMTVAGHSLEYRLISVASSDSPTAGFPARGARLHLSVEGLSRAPGEGVRMQRAGVFTLRQWIFRHAHGPPAARLHASRGSRCVARALGSAVDSQAHSLRPQRRRLDRDHPRRLGAADCRRHDPLRSPHLRRRYRNPKYSGNQGCLRIHRLPVAPRAPSRRCRSNFSRLERHLAAR